METQKIRLGKITLRPLERFTDPRECQIDIEPPYDKTAQGERVMPFADGADEKFISYLKRKTKTFQVLDSSHFWVSGYYEVHFFLKSGKDRAKAKKLVQDAVKHAGGFMTTEHWEKVKESRKRGRFVSASGSGRNIQVSGLVNPAYM